MRKYKMKRGLNSHGLNSIPQVDHASVNHLQRFVKFIDEHQSDLDIILLIDVRI